MKKILMICPYFGHLPNYFPFTLASMAANKDVNWLLLTDDHTEFDYPQNVKVVYTTFSELCKRIREVMPVNVSLHAPYCLCDIKPFYGKVFSDYLQGYDFWGHHDLDMIFGDMRNFFTEDRLSSFDRLLYLGACSLYRNTNIINDFLLREITQIPLANQALCEGWNLALDEIIANVLMRKHGFRIWEANEIFADIDPLRKSFRRVEAAFPIEETQRAFINTYPKQGKMVFSWNRGKLFAHILQQGIMIEQEYLYLHVQKREMTTTIEPGDRFIVVPNTFLPWQTIDNHFVSKYAKGGLYGQYFKLKWQHLQLRIARLCQ